jgi:hypothetical protein
MRKNKIWAIYMMKVVKDNDNGRDNIYVNITINNNLGQAQTLPFQNPASFSITNRIPLLDKASDYYCSVIRFDIPLNVVPIMIMPIVPLPNTNVNLTPFIFGISFSGTNYPSPVIYIPNSSTTLYPPPVINNDPYNRYYWCFTYQVLLNMVNNSLLSSHLAAGVGGAAPYFTLNNATGLISLIVSTAYNTGMNPPIIYMNASCISYFEGIQVKFYGVNKPQGRDFDFVFTDLTHPYYPNGPTIITGPLTPPVTGYTQSVYQVPEFYQYEQEYSTLGRWSSLRKILITTNSIPVAYEWTIAGANNDTQFPILTDFIPQITRQGQAREIAYYVPASQYRLIDMISSAPLQKIDLQLFWETTDGQIFPISITQFQEANIKLGFFRKSLYKPMNLLLK